LAKSQEPAAKPGGHLQKVKKKHKTEEVCSTGHENDSHSARHFRNRTKSQVLGRPPSSSRDLRVQV